MKRVVLIAMFVSLLAAGCSDDKKPSSNAADAETQVVTEYKDPLTPTTTTTTTAPGGGTTTVPGGTQGTTPTSQGQGAPGSTTTTRPPFPVEMKLDKACVKRGANGDTQTLTVKTRAKDTVAYSTEYSDHSNELSNPEYKSGSGYGDADDDGDYKAEWKIPDTAPNGIARLHVIADGRIHSKLTFRVVGPLESC